MDDRTDDPRPARRRLSEDAIELPKRLSLALETRWRALPEDDEEGFGPREDAPRPAPRQVFAAAAVELESAIPSWVPAFWSCRINVSDFAHVAREDLAAHMTRITARAHAAGAPATARFFAGWPSSDRATTYFGFDAAPREEPNASGMVRYFSEARDPSRRVRRTSALEYLGDLDRIAQLAADEGGLRLPQPARGDLRIPWEDETAPERSDERTPARVRHPKFGEGTVVERTGEGPTEKLVIHFDEVGPKTLLARFVERLEGPAATPDP